MYAIDNTERVNRLIELERLMATYPKGGDVYRVSRWLISEMIFSAKKGHTIHMPQDLDEVFDLARSYIRWSNSLYGNIRM